MVMSSGEEVAASIVSSLLATANFTSYYTYGCGSRNRQMVTSIAIAEAGTACSEDVVAHACRGMRGKGSKGYLPERRLRYP